MMIMSSMLLKSELLDLTSGIMIYHYVVINHLPHPLPYQQVEKNGPIWLNIL